MDTGTALHSLKPISGYQFAVFRIALGLYLAVHFSELAPYAAELFSREGVIGDASRNPTYGILPNPLERWDSPGFTTSFVVALAVLSLVFALGYRRRLVAVVLWYGSACLFNRNNLISNPSLAYVGLLLLLCAVVPAGEPLVPFRRKREDWFFPAWAFRTAWILLAVGYTASGLDKLLFSPSWRDGSALTHVLELPLARPGFFRELVLGFPFWIRALMSWGALGLEVSFLPLSMFRRIRPWIWLAMIGMHAGIVLFVAFAELSIGMLLVHAFTFDPEWLNPARDEEKRLVLFDGVCVLCDSSMRFLVEEDRGEVLSFAPLQGVTAREILARHPEADGSLSTVLYVRAFGRDGERLYDRSEAAFRLLDDVGGFWRVVSWFRFLPVFVRDGLYRWVATNRYRWFGRLDECRLPAAGDEKRFLP